MARLYPYIFADDCQKQADFYVKALRGEIIMKETYAAMPGGAPEHLKNKIMHLRLQAVGQIFFMADSFQEPVTRGVSIDLALEFAAEEEARQTFAALAEGGSVLLPFARQFWGTTMGMVQDPFGVRWQITTES